MSKQQIHQDKLIVVTGGAGSMGSGVIRELNDRGFVNIAVIDDLGIDHKWKNLVGKQLSEIVPISDTFHWLEGRHEDIQAFIHLGAWSDKKEIDAEYLLENNTRFSIDIAEYALKHSHRFIYASSAATYGDGAEGFSDDHAKIDTLRPLDMYGYSKHLFDQWCLRQGVLEEVAGLKYFTLFGPNEGHKGEIASPLYRWYLQMEKGEPIQLYKSTDPEKYCDGDQKRDLIYVKDAARMTISFLENDLSGIFNIGSGQATSWNEVARTFFKAAGKPENITYVEMPPQVAAHYQSFTQADMTKGQRHAKFPSATLPLEEAVADCLQNHLIPGKLW